MGTYLDKINKELVKLKPNILPQDKKEYVAAHNSSEFTVSTYLNGRGRNLDTAVKMFKFFREIVRAREVDINKVLNE